MMNHKLRESKWFLQIVQNKQKKTMKGPKDKILDFIFNPETFALNSSGKNVSASAMEAYARVVFRRLHEHLENLPCKKYLLYEGPTQAVFYG